MKAGWQYKKGRRFEWKVRDKLKKEGYFCVRQAKSSFPDLIAFGYAFNDIGEPRSVVEILAVECKVGKYLSQEEKTAIQEIKKYGARTFRAYPKRTGRKVEIIMEEI